MLTIEDIDVLRFIRDHISTESMDRAFVMGEGDYTDAYIMNYDCGWPNKLPNGACPPMNTYDKENES